MFEIFAIEIGVVEFFSCLVERKSDTPRLKWEFIGKGESGADVCGDCFVSDFYACAEGGGCEVESVVPSDDRMRCNDCPDSELLIEGL